MPKIILLPNNSGRLVLYTRQEVANLLGISQRTVWQYIKDERLPAVMINHRLYVWDKNLVAFLAGAKSTHSKNKVSAPSYHNQEFYN